MSEWDLIEHDGTGNTLAQRHRARLTAARQIIKEHGEISAGAANDLEELLDMLGLLPSQAEKMSYRTKLRDCGPVLRQGNRR